MGYDMYIADGPDEAETAAVEAAAALLGELVSRLQTAASEDEAEGLRGEIDQRYNEVRTAQRSYYRLNVWGMGAARELMGAFGMLTDEFMPVWPEPEAYGLTESPEDPNWFREGPERQKAEEALTAAGRLFLADQDAVVEADHGGPGIPGYKFTSNDGWLVTPREIEAALKAYDNADPKDRDAVSQDEPWWPSWIAYLSFARERGGFRVH